MTAGGSHSTNLGLRQNPRLDEMKGEMGQVVRAAGASGVCGGGSGGGGVGAAEDRRSPKKGGEKLQIKVGERLSAPRPDTLSMSVCDYSLTCCLWLGVYMDPPRVGTDTHANTHMHIHNTHS